MLYKEISAPDNKKKVSITRSKNTNTRNKNTKTYDYYLMILCWNELNGGSWVINDRYKQIESISSSSIAVKTAKELLLKF